MIPEVTGIQRVGGVEVPTTDAAGLGTWAVEQGHTFREAVALGLDAGIWPEGLVRNHPFFSAAEQARIVRGTVAIAGCGGLGGYLATLCARAGVGGFILADHDVFDPTNANRQALCDMGTLGRQKAVVCAAHCRAVHPWIEARAVAMEITEGNAIEIMAGADVVLDGLDRTAARFVLCGAAARLGVPYVHGAVLAASGQASTFLPGAATGLESLYPDKQDTADPPGVVSTAPAIVASIQTREALRILAGHPPVMCGKLIYFDGEDSSVYTMELMPHTPESIT
ncbi:MAG: HesA/MoeB/ThiF family protein [Desulfatibacillaceae bacterium]